MSPDTADPEAVADSGTEVGEGGVTRWWVTRGRVCEKKKSEVRRGRVCEQREGV